MDGSIIWYIVYGVLGLLIAVTLINFVVTQIKQRLMPKERRYELVAAELRRNETDTGATAMSGTAIAGIREADIRKVAAQQGYEWAGYTHRNSGVMNFQRPLASDQPNQTGDAQAPTDLRRYTVTTEHAKSVVAQRVAELTPDTDGLYRLDVTDLEPESRSLKPVTGMLTKQGWKVRRIDTDGGGTVLELTKTGTTAVETLDELFLPKGPSIKALRRNAAARAEAERVRAETGLDALSGAELERARKAHKTAFGRFQKYAWLGVLAALVSGIAAAVWVNVSSVDADLKVGGLVVVIVAAVACLACWFTAGRIEVGRRRSLRPFRAAYTRVAEAAAGSQPSD